jgi:hypothetical protein
MRRATALRRVYVEREPTWHPAQRGAAATLIYCEPTGNKQHKRSMAGSIIPGVGHR